MNEKQKVSTFTQMLLDETNSYVSFKITTILEPYEQMNLIREGRTDDFRFKVLDDLRSVSNDVEKKIKKAKTIKALEKIDVDELFRKDERLIGDDGNFIPDTLKEERESH